MLRRERLKNNKGFSLVEIIIAIAILAVFSGVVLQLFLLSSRLSNRVALQDSSAAQMQNMLEIFKQDPDAVYTSDLMREAQWSKQGAQDQFVLLFDKDFNMLPAGQADKAAIRISGVVGPAQPQEGMSTEPKPLPTRLTPTEDDPECRLMSMQIQAERVEKDELIVLSTTGTLKYVLPRADTSGGAAE